MNVTLRNSRIAATIPSSIPLVAGRGTRIRICLTRVKCYARVAGGFDKKAPDRRTLGYLFFGL